MKKFDKNLLICTGLLLLMSILQLRYELAKWGMMLVITFTSLYLLRHSDRFSMHEEGSPKWRTYCYLVFLGLFIAWMLFFVHMVVKTPVSIQGSQLILLVFVMVYGNLAPKIPYNRTMGLRLPWTLRNEQTWRYAHRVTGYCTIPCVLGMLIGVLINQEIIYFICLLLWVLIPMIVSYAYETKRRN